MDTFPWAMSLWGGANLLLLLVVGWLANRPQTKERLDHQIAITQAKLDYWQAERARRFGHHPLKPTFHELQDEANRMDHGN